MNLDDREERSIACAEFVLGTLADAEREAIVAKLAADHELRADVGFWQDHLLGLVRKVPPVEPSEQVWDRIEAALPVAEKLRLLDAMRERSLTIRNSSPTVIREEPPTTGGSLERPSSRRDEGN